MIWVNLHIDPELQTPYLMPVDWDTAGRGRVSCEAFSGASLSRLISDLTEVETSSSLELSSEAPRMNLSFSRASSTVLNLNLGDSQQVGGASVWPDGLWVMAGGFSFFSDDGDWDLWSINAHVKKASLRLYLPGEHTNTRGGGQSYRNFSSHSIRAEKIYIRIRRP